MNIPKHWAKEVQPVIRPSGRPFLAQAWRSSDSSPDEARRRAREAVEAIVRKLAAGEELDSYGYGERPLREEVLQTITDHRDEPAAVITRNGYGALILNTARVMFVDIDFPDEVGSLSASLGKLFGRKTVSREEERLQFLHQWTAGNPGWGMCVYRTKAGLRCLVTHDVYDPSAAGTVDLLRSLGSDPLYVTLCRQQGSFRARLTPKPWRRGFANPPSRFPWDSDEEQQHFRQWEQGYQAAIAGFTTCRLLAVVGVQQDHPEARLVRELHDRYACVDDRFALA